MSYAAISAIVNLAEKDPRSAVARADALDDSASLVERIGARWGAGIALRTLGDVDRSLLEMSLARDLSECAGDDVLAADIDVTIAGSLAVAGKVEDGYRLAQSAGKRLPDDLKAHAWIQEATFAARQGDLDAAFELFERAESVLTKTGDVRWLGRLYNNRGLIGVYVGRPDQALADLERAAKIFADLGFDFALAEAGHNLGFAHVQRGDLAIGLGMYERASAAFRRLDCPLNELLIDHTEALVAAGMYSLAAEMAAELAATVGDGTMVLDRAETFFLYARASYLSGDWIASAQAAEDAAEAFESVGAAGWLARTRLLKMRAEEQLGGASDVTSALSASEAAIAAGQTVAGWHGLLLAARAAAGTGSVREASHMVERVRGASDDSGIALVELKLDLAVTEILLARVEGHSDTAFQIAQRAIDEVHTSASAVAYSGQSAALATQRVEVLEHVGTDLAADRGASALVSWTDSVRHLSLSYPQLTHPVDPERASMLENLRAVDDDYRNLQSIELASERSVILERLAERSAPSDVRTSRRESDTRLVVSSGATDLYATMVTDESAVGLGRYPVDAVVLACDHIRLGLANSDIDIQPDDISVVQSLVPGDVGVPGTAVTVCPPSMLTSFPWTLVPGLSDSAVAIESPAGSRGNRETCVFGPTFAVAGSGLATADEEAARIAAVAGDGRMIASRAVTLQAVTVAMQEAAVFHFAGHSVFRIDNPGLSYLDLGRDRLHAWELERLPRVPHTVVLASCDSGGAASAGLGVAGFVSTLLALGVREVVASVVPVPDTQETSDMMVHLHIELARGANAAEALKRVRAKTRPSIAHSFQAFI